MPVAEFDGARIVVETEFRDREIVKLVPGIKWDADARVWALPLSWAACMQLRGVFGSDLGIGPNLNSWAAAEIANRVEPCLALRTADDCTDPWMLTRLQQLGYYDAEG